MRVLVIANCKYYHVGGFFINALRSMGMEYMAVDEALLVERFLRTPAHKLAYRVLRRPISYWAFQKHILNAARYFRPQMVLVTKGAWVAPHTLAQVKTITSATLINYATDDPFNPKNATPDLLKGIPLYDLYVCTKRAIMADVGRAGGRRVVYVPFGYEPSLHYPEAPANAEERQRFQSDVLFIGGADSDRFPILRKVAAIPAVQLHLYGGYWQRDRQLHPYYRGFAYGRDYRLALQGARIALCLVRRANRDGHVMRTFETPACGAFMLAERTAEHLSFFAEGEEMACFGSDEELVEKIKYYLAHAVERQRIAEAGYRRVTTAKYTYRDRLEEILRHAEVLL